MISDWVPLEVYAKRYSVSMSTLRRRIQNHSVDWIVRNGKYLIPNEPLKQALFTRSPKKKACPHCGGDV